MCVARGILTQWMPDESKPTQDCTVLEAWARMYDKVRDYCDLAPRTMEAYTKHLSNIEEALRDKTVTEMTAYDCWDAARSVLIKKDGRPYSGSSLYGRLLVMGHLFALLDAKNICHNPLWAPPWELLEYACKDIILASTVDDIKRVLQEVLRHTRNDLRSINRAEERKLVREIVRHLHEDGRYLGLLIYLYFGVRPAEGRGITYGDIKAYTFDPARHYVNIVTSMTQGTERAERLKTKTSYRRLPVHIEVEMLIQQRIQQIKDETGVDNIDDYPLICYKNEYERPCTHGEMEYFAKALFEKCLSKETLRGVLLDMYDDADGDSGAGADADERAQARQLPSLYILRKNFCSKCYAETCLDEDEVRLLMGHELETTEFMPYCEQAVYEYGLKMDHRMIDPELRSDWHTIVEHGMCVELQNVGVHCITIPPEVIAKGVTLCIDMVTMLPGDSIMLQHGALPEGTTITYEEEDFWYNSAVDVPLNIDASTWPLQDWLDLDDDN